MDSQKSKRPAILELHNLGKSVKEITRALSVTKWSVYRTLKRFNEIGMTVDKPRSGRPRSVRTKQLKKSVRERIKFNPKRCVQKMAKEYNISTRTMGRLLNHDLGLKSYKFRKVQLLSYQPKARDAGNSEIVSRVADTLKFFLQAKHNDRILSSNKRDLLYKGWLRELRNLLLSWSGLALHLLVGPPCIY